jgi:hypothetical protein
MLVCNNLSGFCSGGIAHDIFHSSDRSNGFRQLSQEERRKVISSMMDANFREEFLCEKVPLGILIM